MENFTIYEVVEIAHAYDVEAESEMEAIQKLSEGLENGNRLPEYDKEISRVIES